MVRVCATCQRSYSGGADCPLCGVGHPLMEACDPAARHVLGRQSWAGIRALYGARRAMLLAIGGLLWAPAVALLLFRRSFSAIVEVDRMIWISLAALAGVSILAVTLIRGARIARRTRKDYDDDV